MNAALLHGYYVVLLYLIHYLYLVHPHSDIITVVQVPHNNAQYTHYINVLLPLTLVASDF